MKLSYIIVTHNRRESLLRTLGILHGNTPLSAEKWEAWVVDNGSTDGTLDAVRRQFPGVRIIARPTNEGVWSRSYAFAPARGEYVILLDDDSYPVGNAVPRSIEYLDSNPDCAAVVGLVVLPDGSFEACAFPTVMLSGAVCIRRSVLLNVGGFRPEFFRKAGEYDLSFRIWNAGHRIARFEDIVYRHDKVATGRSAGFAHRMDLRNNLILIERYLPAHLRGEYRRDWIQRYCALAAYAGHASSTTLARLEGLSWRIREAMSGRQTLLQATVETIFELESQEATIAAWASCHGVRNVVIADFSKNMFATYAGCLRAGLRVKAVADLQPAFANLNYRGVPVLSDTAALSLSPDGIVISNVNPAQVDGVLRRLSDVTAIPVLKLWNPSLLGELRQAA